MTDPTKEDREAAEAWVRNMCWFGSATDVAGRGREAYAHGRASMRAEIVEMVGGEGSPSTAELIAHIRAMEAREVEGQLAQARALLREAETVIARECDRAMLGFEATDGTRESVLTDIRAHLESEGNDE